MSWTDTAAAAVKWPAKQAWGAAQNIWRWITVELQPTDIIIPYIWSMLVWLSDQVPRALGGDTPGRQITGSVVLAVATVVGTFWTGLTMLLILAVLFLFFSIGVLRMFPAVNDAWTRYWPLYPMSVDIPE